MADADREELYRAAMEAFNAAKEAFAKNPRPGTPEWDEWRRLFQEAVAANDAYIRRSNSGEFWDKRFRKEY